MKLKKEKIFSEEHFMKEWHLVCNAHLDPIWQWNWDEGAGCALSTVYSAVEIAKENDNVVFCHNEMHFYEIIEEHDPDLFREIGELVKEGKWQIIGGWYVQPDCITPSGEAFMRQIELGRKYFMERFGAYPRTAVNFDSFGHSRGLVQIFEKNGYDSYLICRPCEFETHYDRDLFSWVGYEGSSVKVLRYRGKEMYTSPLGKAREIIEWRMANANPAEKGAESGLALWGVGNHGGGPSRADLCDIAAMQKESLVPILHSTPERYFDAVTPLDTVSATLGNCFIKCYTSMSRVKTLHAELENKLFLTEKICAAAEREKGLIYDTAAFHEVMRTLAFLGFHDVLSGTVVESGEKYALQRGSHALEILDRMRMRAYFVLCSDFKPAKENEYPLFIFNPAPYEVEDVVECEFLILNGMVSDEVYYHVTAKQNGKEILCQQIKEEANLNMERRKRLALRVTLPAMSMTRVDLTYDERPRKPLPAPQGDIVCRDSVKCVTVDGKTGLIKSYRMGDRELLAGEIFRPFLFDDNADPWGYGLKYVGSNMREMPLSDGTEEIYKGFLGCHVTEDGDVLTQIESHYMREGVALRLVYKIYKDLPHTDVMCEINYQDKLKGVRLGFAIDGDAESATVFGRELLPRDKTEKPMQRFLRFENGFTVLNENTFACMGDENAVYLTLLNGSAYCAHKIDDRPFIDMTRFIRPIEAGVHVFNYRIGYMADEEVEAKANAFCQKPFGINYFPHGKGEKAPLEWDVPLSLALLSSRVTEQGLTVRLLNNSKEDRTENVIISGVSKTLSFKAFEFKTLLVSEDIKEV